MVSESEPNGWSSATVSFEVLGHGDNAVVLQVDEYGMPYTPEPLMVNGKPVEITFGKTTLKLHKGDPGV